MEYLREFLARELQDGSVASYSGAGGAWRDGSGRWITCSKEESLLAFADRMLCGCSRPRRAHRQRDEIVAPGAWGRVI